MSKRGSGEKAPPTEEELYRQFQEFLRCPIWILPVMSFIEQRSLLFDRDQEDETLFRSVHEEYCSMVDMLIGCFCEDINVDPKAVVKAVEKAAPQARTDSEKNVLEPVIATQDFDVFLHMMMRKNIELQLQALHMLEVVYGIVPAILVPGTSSDGASDQEQIIMIEVIRKSQDEFEKDQKLSSEERSQMERALQESLSEKERLEQERLREQKMLDQAVRLSLEESKNTPVMVHAKTTTDKRDSKATVSQPGKRSSKSEAKVALRPLRNATKGDKPSATESDQNPKSTEESPPDPNGGAASKVQLKPKESSIPADLETRKKYLFEQRDRLLQLKKAEREKAFSSAESDSKASRPKTAKAARNVMSGGRAAAGINSDVLAARKALADKLKAEMNVPE